jgi:hypothetical protein
MSKTGESKPPLTFDSDETRLLITMLGREGTAAMQHGMTKDRMEFVARCFEVAAKVARS